MNILSFDCANRSLAVIYAYMEKNPNDIKKSNITKINISKVYDLTEGKKVNTAIRTLLLKRCLQSIDLEIKGMEIKYRNPTNILIEYQMSANDKSRCVSQQILYHYSGINNLQVELVGPTLKNKICFSEDDSLSYGTFMERYASKYTANKNHSKANFLYWLERNNLMSIVSKNNIAKKNIDDIADAFTQIYGWLLFGKKYK